MTEDKKKGVPKPKKKEKKFIEFSKVHQTLLRERSAKAQRELNDTLMLIYEDLGIDPKDFGQQQYILRQDFSGIDFPDEPIKGGEIDE
jgi:hypothetical protein